jgi:uncharacterized protein DUF6941
MSERPIAIGLLACDQVIVEEHTRNVTPVNCFTYRKVRGFPSEPQSFTVLAFLTDGLGEIELEVVLQDLDNMEELYRVGRRVVFNSPLHEYRFVFRFRDISFPAEGAYEIMLIADNELVAARKIRIEQRGDR